MDDTGVRLMKATKAYIASLGTTGVLLGASILMLAVVSAVVAFDGWPNGHVSTRVQTLVLTEKPSPIRVNARPAALQTASPTRTPAAGALARRAPQGNAPGARTRPVTRGTIPAAPAKPVAPLPAAVSKPLAPVTNGSEQIITVISNPSTTAGQVADGVQQTTDATGVSLGRLSPQLGSAVAGTGETVAATVRAVPLPDHVLPGH